MRKYLCSSLVLGVAFALGAPACDATNSTLHGVDGGTVLEGAGSTGNGGAATGVVVAGGATAGQGGSQAAAVGGAITNGGTSASSGGLVGTGGVSQDGGASATGGTQSLPAAGGLTSGNGGTPALGGSANTGGTMATSAAGGALITGGTMATGGAPATGGTPITTGGNNPTGGNSATGGAATGGAATGGAATGGAATGGAATGGAATGGAATGGAATGGAATGGASTTSTGTAVIDCSAAMPTGGTMHTGTSQGGSGNLTWQLWMNGSGGSITTFSTPAFSATWANSGDLLARLGFEWGTSGKAYTAYGTIAAQFAETRSGTGGGYSYIGIYGWSNNPCIEYYIVEDSYSTMPVNPGNSTNNGTVTIDGGDYILYSRPTSGTGGSRCNGISSWTQYYSVRKTARQCGQISISQHFDAWASKSMTLGTLVEVKILVETGGGSGSINFPIANVTTTQ